MGNRYKKNPARKVAGEVQVPANPTQLSAMLRPLAADAAYAGALAASFGTPGAYEATLDAVLPPGTGSFFSHISLLHRAGQDPDDFVRDFVAQAVKGWTAGGRTKLPILAADVLSHSGIDIQKLFVPGAVTADPEADAAARALMLVSLRAEMIRGQPPGPSVEANHYHDAVHSSHVGLAASWLTARNETLAAAGKAESLALKQRLMVILTAFCHDTDHPGRDNPKNDAFYNEEVTFRAVKPLLKAAGMADADIKAVHVMLLGTSPDGPLGVLRKAASEFHEGRVPDPAVIDPGAKFMALAPLFRDRALCRMAAIISDSDLFASAGAGLESGMVMATRFTQEKRKAGLNVDLTTDEEGIGFYDGVVGKSGFVSEAARVSFNRQFEDARDCIRQRLAAKAASGGAGGPSISP